MYLLLVAFAVNIVMQQRQSIFPEVSFPTAKFKVDYGFAPLTEMETIFGKPVDSLIASSIGVLTYQSTLERGYAEFKVSLDAGRDFQSDFQLLKGKVATLVQAAPRSNGVSASLGAELTGSNDLALLGYSLVSPTAGYLELRKVVDNRIVPALQQVQGIGRIEVIGGSLPEVQIELDPAKLALYQMSPDAVISQVTEASGTQFLGTFNEYGKLILGFSASTLTGVGSISALPIRTSTATLQLSELASVQSAASTPNVLTSTDQTPSVLFNVYGAPNVDVVSLSLEVTTAIDTLRSTLQSSMTITNWYALSDFINTSLGNVSQAILIGVVIVSLSILVFLQSWRASIPVVAAMLVTVVLTFIAMEAMGETLNIMTLAGISAAIGLIVDDAIVAVENIARFHEAGHDRETSIVRGTTEVLSPLLSSTLTTVAVFAPLGLLTGITGFLFKASAFVIVASLLISLVMAVTLAPILAYWLMKPAPKTEELPKDGFFKRHYRRFLIGTLKAPLLIVLVGGAIFVSSIYLGRSLPTSYLPRWDEGTFVMDMDASAGTSREEMARQVAEVEKVIGALPVIQTYSRQIGDSALQTNQAHFFMHPKPSGTDGTGSVFQVMDDLETTLLDQFPNLNVDLHQILPDHFGGLAGKSNQVSIDVFASNLPDLLAAGSTISDAVGKLSGIDKIKLKKPESVTQFDLSLDANKLLLHNLSRAEVNSQVQIALQGSEIGFVTVDDRQAALRVIYPDSWRNFSPSLIDMTIFARDGKAVPLSAVANVKLRSAPDLVTRKQGHLFLSVIASTKTADLGSNAQQISAELQKLALPAGAYALVSGDWKRQVKAFAELRNVFLFAVGLVFTLLLVFFRSYGYATLILLNTLISLSFVIFGIWFFATPFNVPTFMGLISVMGIVVKNGILVMAFLADNLRKGESRVEAIIDASLTRARPILMTSAAAILGFLPMALSSGRGGEMMQPFAAAVIFGVVGGVLSSLILLPSMYIIGGWLTPKSKGLETAKITKR